MHKTTIKRLESTYYISISDVEELDTDNNKVIFRIWNNFNVGHGYAWVLVKHGETYHDCITTTLRRMANLQNIREIMDNNGDDIVSQSMLIALKFLKKELDPLDYNTY
ncbi:hypothetical protein [Paraburkholderia fungorum]|uniref:hypothetical protein n=1 Tax=Paraburkholderia fungorum TaxID=134537 RepID=UPI000D05E766|nr:hypothetical protein [Paraburkholderia fungorum]PRZ45399.1 hypothetical protein BX589_13978 [Paraburkholderia fungorum]